MRTNDVVARLRDRARALTRAYPRATKYSAITLAALFVITCGLTGYYYVKFSSMIDARLHGERDRVLPRVFARPLEIRRSEGLSQKEVVDRLNDLGYAQRTQPQNPGEFAVNGPVVAVIPRAGSHTGKLLTISFQRPAPPRRAGRGAPPPPPATISTRIEALAVDKKPVSRVTLDAPMLTALIQARVKRRQVPLSALPTRVVEAVLAIEDRRYYSHPGVDPIRMVGALFRNTFGDRHVPRRREHHHAAACEKFLPH